MSTINPSPDNNPWESQIINTPQPIKIAISDGYMTLLKQDVEIFRFSVDDKKLAKNLEIALTGLLRVGAVYGEIENIRDILKEVREGND